MPNFCFFIKWLPLTVSTGTKENRTNSAAALQQDVTAIYRSLILPEIVNLSRQSYVSQRMVVFWINVDHLRGPSVQWFYLLQVSLSGYQRLRVSLWLSNTKLSQWTTPRLSSQVQIPKGVMLKMCLTTCLSWNKHACSVASGSICATIQIGSCTATDFCSHLMLDDRTATTRRIQETSIWQKEGCRLAPFLSGHFRIQRQKRIFAYL